MDSQELLAQHEESQAAQIALWDDFAVTPESDPGLVRSIRYRGRDLAFTFRSGITLAERSQAAAVGIKKHLDTTGRVVIDSVDETAATHAILALVLKAWPFTTADGTPVPLDLAHVQKLDAGLCDLLTREYAFITQARTDALVPFESPSPAA